MARPYILDLSDSFTAYANRMKKQMSLLEHVSLPAPIIWKIDWETLSQIQSEAGKRKNWKAVKIFKELEAHTKNPCLYYFTINTKSAKEILTAFRNAKNISSDYRKDSGLRQKAFFNLCNIPRNVETNQYLYAGSVKANIHSRLKNHLGMENSGRTGSLHLKRVMDLAKYTFPVTFFVHVLDKKYKNISEHMECVLQDKLNPMLGKRAFKAFIEE